MTRNEPVSPFGWTFMRPDAKDALRIDENQKFLDMTTVPRKYAKLAKLQWRDRKVSRYYICKSCHQQIRVPKGKGRIEIRCPKCNERFIKKT